MNIRQDSLKRPQKNQGIVLKLLLCLILSFTLLNGLSMYKETSAQNTNSSGFNNSFKSNNNISSINLSNQNNNQS
ncbi:MAG: hypothetical protein ACTHKK_06075, partial [Candidatus Nitrosocosmicus sp.]